MKYMLIQGFIEDFKLMNHAVWEYFRREFLTHRRGIANCVGFIYKGPFSVLIALS